MVKLTHDTTDDYEEWVATFMAEQQRLADKEGVHVLVYMARANGGMLKGVITKLLRHAQAHPNECPEDCAFQSSIKELKKRYGISDTPS